MMGDRFDQVAAAYEAEVRNLAATLVEREGLPPVEAIRRACDFVKRDRSKRREFSDIARLAKEAP
jgi:hypothetical protein